MGQMTLTELVDDYVRSAVLRPKSIDNYRCAARMLSSHLGADLPIDQISEEHLLSFRKAVLERASAQTFNNYRRHLSILFR